MIRYDRSPFSVVVTCSCGHRELCLTQEGAWRAARAHETTVHPDRFQVRHAEAVREQRRRDQDEDG